MSLENSLEALAGALQAHAGALEKLAAALAVRQAANAERFAKAAETPQKAEPETAPVAEQAAAGKISEEKPKAFSLADARSKATALLKNRGADALRGLLDSVGVKKLSALTAAQIQVFCANADKALQEA